MHTAKSLKNKITSYFHTTKKTSKKKNVLACILALITSLLKSQELSQYFKIFKKKLFFS
jgi:excinuclease UvrABC nuclease subunit